MLLQYSAKDILVHTGWFESAQVNIDWNQNDVLDGPGLEQYLNAELFGAFPVKGQTSPFLITSKCDKRRTELAICKIRVAAPSALIKDKNTNGLAIQS